MLYIIQWNISCENRNAAMARFVQTGGAPPPGLKVHGRWHAIGHHFGVAVAETDDLSLVLKWVLEWSDLMDMKVYPAMTDEETAPLLQAALSRVST